MQNSFTNHQNHCSTTTSWPFDSWGMDMVGLMPESAEGHVYILIQVQEVSLVHVLSPSHRLGGSFQQDPLQYPKEGTDHPICVSLRSRSRSPP
ncbi:hypothetical protein LIER_28233 [Lithospermum erythrorhizon]|uniref:Uncharacterized protein n=1 Tax=Lithospermum erythrorhizon TaxID=34254 RepID=A0AAV3REY9_LITER